MGLENNDKINNSEENSSFDLIVIIKKTILYFKNKWRIILAISFLGGLLGIVYSIYTKPTYTAVCTFVLDDSKGDNISQYASLASLAGVSVGGRAGGVFEGDNILELYKSRLMIEKAFLSKSDFNGKEELLIDRFLDCYKLRNKTIITFNGSSDHFNRAQDSVVTALVGFFNSKILNVTKPDKKLSIIQVTVTTKDELFSKYFTEQLVKNVNDFYIETKTKTQYQNVQVLQRQCDSLRQMLNLSINSVANASDSAPNANPLLSTLKVPLQKKQIDLQVNSAMYTEIIKNLEVSKMALRQETPLIQIIDEPILPLFVNKIGKIKSAILGTILGAFIVLTILVVKKGVNYLTS
jgi:hypothetical protein